MVLPFGDDFKGKPAKGSGSDTPEKHDRHHRLHSLCSTGERQSRVQGTRPAPRGFETARGRTHACGDFAACNGARRLAA
jgi:hypothetical protein